MLCLSRKICFIIEFEDRLEEMLFGNYTRNVNQTNSG